MRIPGARFLRSVVGCWSRPCPIAEEELRCALSAYDLGAFHTIRPLRIQSRNCNVLVVTDRGSWILKVYKASLGAAAIEFEHSVLQHLAIHQFPAPRLVLTRSGETGVQREGHCSALFEFIPGHSLEPVFLQSSRRLTYLTSTAEIVARYHQTVNGFAPSGCKRDGFKPDNSARWHDHAWFADQIADCQKQLQGNRVLADRLEIIQRNLYDLGERLTRAGATCTRLAVHGDIGPYNLRVRPDGSLVLLDFDCCHMQLRAYDVISALVNCAPRRDGNLNLFLATRFFAAYQNIWPLGQEAIQLMPSVYRYVKLCGLVWQLRDAIRQQQIIDARWLQARLIWADWLEAHGNHLVAGLLAVNA